MQQDIEHTLNFYHSEGDCFETCGIGTDRFPKVVDGGFFDNLDKAVEAATQLGTDHNAVYLTINPVKDALLGRANNRIKRNLERTQDKEIVSIRCLLIDIDAVRPTNVSSSNEEHDAALALCARIKEDLTRQGWPDPLVGDSGNGGHLVYRIEDLPNNADSVDLIKRCLQALAKRYDTDNLQVDQKVFNPSRISKVYGTWVRKGDSTSNRPHRQSKIIFLPVFPVDVPVARLRELAGEVPQVSPPIHGSTGYGNKFDIKGFLDRYGVRVMKEKAHGDSILYVLETCLFNDSHSPGEASIGQRSDGLLFYQCHHNSCKGKTWHDARQIIAGDSGRQSDRHYSPPPQVSDEELEQLYGSKPDKNVVPSIPSVPNVTDVTSSHNSHSDVTNGHNDNSDVTNGHKPEPETKPQTKSQVFGSTEKHYADKLRAWLDCCDGEFTITEILRELGIQGNSTASAAIRKALQRFVKSGVITRSERGRGTYIIINSKIDKEKEIDILNISISEFPLKLPLGLHRLAEVNPKEIVLVAGETNAGKTAFILNAIWMNIFHLSSLDLLRSRGSESPGRPGIGIRYFSSEAGAPVIRKKLLQFGPSYPIEQFAANVTIIGANIGFQYMLDPCGINCIDYLEAPNGEYFMITPTISAIHAALDTGIAIIAIQKAIGTHIGRGGQGTLEKPRLAIALRKDDKGYFTARLTKVKAPRNGLNIDGMEIDFVIERGVKIVELSDWGYPQDHKDARKARKPIREGLVHDNSEDSEVPF